jgi:hypothetical protein
VDLIFKTLSRVECSPVSVRLRIIHHNIFVGLTNTNTMDTYKAPTLGSEGKDLIDEHGSFTLDSP